MTQLALLDEHAKMGKISNNLELHGEAQSVITGFTLPIELQVPRAQLVQLMGEDFDRAVWTVDATGMVTGTDWARRLLALSLSGETYIGVAAVLGLGGRELEFADCHFSKIEILALGNGGMTHLKGHLYVRPGIGSENLLLQEFQEHEIAVSISCGKLRVKADKAQQQLPLDAPSSSASPAADGPPADQAADAAPEGQAIGTPEQEREKAHGRERDIAQRLEHAHLNGDGPDDDEGDDEDDDSMSSLGERISEHAARTA